jgi:chromosome segregation ATPase
MSTKTADVDSSIGKRVEALEQRIETLENQREAQREQNHALARENHELREQVEEQAEEIEQAEESRGYIIQDIVDVEEQLDDVQPGSEGGEGGVQGEETTIRRPDLTPIERLSKIEDTEDTAIEITPSIERAVTIFDHWEDWSQRTPKGNVLKEGLKTLLRTATEDNVNWRQSYRAAEALEELSKGRIQFMKHKRHGKMLLEPASREDCQTATSVG